MGILLGYTEVGYRVLINNRIIVARHVDVVNNDVMYIGFSGNANDETNSKLSNDTSKIEDNETLNESLYDSAESDGNNNGAGEENIEEQVLRRSSRVTKPNPKYTKDFVSYCVYVNYCNVNDPVTFEEAMNHVEFKNWQHAMDTEIRSIQDNNTWVLVNKPNEKKAIDVKWIYKRKSENVYKARLVVKGFQ